MLNLPFLNQKKQAQKKADAVDSGIKMIGFLAACAFLFSLLLLIALTYESIHANQTAIVELALGIPSALFKAFALFLAFLSFVALIASVTAIKWQRAKSEAYALAKVEDQRIVKADQQADSTEQMIKLITAMAALNNGQANPNDKLLSALQALAAPQLPTTVDIAESVLSVLKKSKKPHVILIGETGAGKGTLARHIVKERIKQGHDLLVLEPHDEKGYWPDSALRIGGGEDYQAMNHSLIALNHESKTRFSLAHRGICKFSDFPELTVYIGEQTTLAFLEKKSGRTLGSLILRTRKIGFRFLVDGQSSTVKSLGLEGQGDIRDSLLFVNLKIEGNRRKAFIKDDEVSLAGAFDGFGHHYPKTPRFYSEKAADFFGTTQELVPEPKAEPVRRGGTSRQRLIVRSNDSEPLASVQDPRVNVQESRSEPLKKGAGTTYQTPQQLAEARLSEGFSNREIIKELLGSNFDKKLLSGNRIRGYLKMRKEDCNALIKEVKAEIEKEREERGSLQGSVKIYSSNGHLNGHHN